MKRSSKVFSVVFVAAYLILVGCIGSWIISRITNGAWNGKFVYLHLENIPEGTVFADVLAKGDWEEARDASTTYEDSLGISGHDCEIAR